MLLTLFYMISTWVQGFRLSSLKSRLIQILNYDPKPSIMFYVKPPNVETYETADTDLSVDLLSSNLCSNKNEAKLVDLLWSQGEKRLCSVLPQQKIDTNNWLEFPLGKILFPLSMNNSNRTELNDESKVHILIEADIEQFNPNAFAQATKIEEYGVLVSWTADKIFAAIMETDIDHMTKLSIALMQNTFFINNGLLITRMESVEVIGKPCCYTLPHSKALQDKNLIGKAQWRSHMKKLKMLSKTAHSVSETRNSIDVDGIPGIIVSPGTKPLKLPMPIILQIDSDNGLNHSDEESIHLEDLPIPSTPPPTPASASMFSGRDETQLPPSFNISEASFNNRKTIPDIVFSTESNSQFSYANEPTKSTNLMREVTNNTRTSKYSPGKNPTTKISLPPKPPNVLIYSDSAATRDNIKGVLNRTLNTSKYIIYTLTTNEVRRDIWIDQTNLIVVCGNVDNEIATQLINFIVKGGKILALCSDALHTILPSFKTAEVREHELVRFSYGRWKNVQMMHHIFCYQASPIKTRFSQENEESKPTMPQTPDSARVKDKSGKVHIFQIKVLGKEDTWQTPSIVLADLPSSGGRAVFSQIHLEADPSNYENDETKLSALQESNTARLEILCDLLSSHLKMDVNPQTYDEPVHRPGYFLGLHELKLQMLDRLKDKIKENDIFETPKMILQFCGKTTKMNSASASFLPIMLHSCPENFSTIEYFENLNTNALGRLVIYADVMTSSMNVVDNVEMYHGLAVLTRQQTQGRGRNKNIWLSPEGCAMFTMQLHIPLESYIGRNLPILQHVVGAAVVRAVRTNPGFEDIDLRVKWPNDIYLGDQIKIGGLLVTTLTKSDTAICNIGVGINLSNSLPSSCINDIITRHNEENGTNLAKFTYERFLAVIFNNLEYLLNVMQEGDLKEFYQLYYDYWLHTDAQVNVIMNNGITKEVKILGIDNYGFLEVQGKNGETFVVQPDGNSFDIFKGLIGPSSER